jgi:hypothetical protein
MAMNGRIKKLVVGGLVAGGLMLGAAGPVIAAGVAKADVAGSNPQLSLLLELRGDGFDISEPYASRLINLGHETCAYLEAGASRTSIENDLERREAGYWTENNAIDFVVGTQFQLCPWTLTANERPNTGPTPSPDGDTSGNGELA